MYVCVTVKAYRDCTQDGTWWRNPQNRTWSNYTACVNIEELSVSICSIFSEFTKRQHYIHSFIHSYITAVTAVMSQHRLLPYIVHNVTYSKLSSSLFHFN